jgi:DNA-binding transcriptional LysR family regulator
MTPLQLEALLVLAEELHFGRAAERLGIAQPQLSLVIRRIEQQSGVIAFARRPAVSLTPAGAALVAMAERVRSELAIGIEDARAVAAGRLGHVSLGFTGAALFTPIGQWLRTFQKDNPGVQLALREGASGPLLRQLEAGALDLVMTREAATAPGSASYRLADDQILVVLPSDHPLAAKPSLSLRELGEEPVIFFSRFGAPNYFDRIMHACNAAGWYPRIIQEVESWGATLALVRAGFGITLGTATLANLQISGLSFRSVPDPLPDAAFWISGVESRLTPAAQRLLDMLVKQASEVHPPRACATRVPAP